LRKTNSVNGMILPVTSREIGYLWGQVVAHECGHLLGLVAPGPVLEGTPEDTPDDENGWHNNPRIGKRFMNAGGGTNQVDQLTNRDTVNWGWKPENAAYLQFLLPKEEE